MGIVILFHRSKTIQFREKIVQLPLPYIPGSLLCPATAVQRALSFTHPGATPESQVFMWYDLVTQKLTPFTYPQFMCKLRSTLMILSLPGKDYAGHSFCRGGASYAFQAGIPIELIKILGDWKSDAMLLYLTVPLSIRLQSINEITKSLLPKQFKYIYFDNYYTLWVWGNVCENM